MIQKPSSVVVDASVVLKWQLDDEDCISQATALRDDFYIRGTIIVIAPHLLVYEVVNGIVTAARHKRIAPDMIVFALSNLMALDVQLREVEPLRILETALKYNLSAYDAAYLSLAQTEKCELWTGDKAFYQAIKGKSPLIRWIGKYKPRANHN